MRNIGLVILLLSSSPLAAQNSRSTPSPSDPITVTGQAPKKSCRMVVPLGSNFPQRVCSTAAEAKSEAKANARRTEAYIHDKSVMSQRLPPCKSC